MRKQAASAKEQTFRHHVLWETMHEIVQCSFSLKEGERSGKVEVEKRQVMNGHVLGWVPLRIDPEIRT